MALGEDGGRPQGFTLCFKSHLVLGFREKGSPSWASAAHLGDLGAWSSPSHRGHLEPEDLICPSRSVHPLGH